MRVAIVAFCCLLLAGVSAAQGTSPTKHALCTVSGQVVQDPGGIPVKKAVLTLVLAQSESGDATHTEYSTVTDAEGHFQMNGVQSGDYRVTLERNGFVFTSHRSRTYSSTSLLLTPGQEITNLLFRMLPAGVIQGRIVDEDGDPLPDVEVAVSRPTNPAAVGNTRTNDLGEFRIAGLAGGEYFVAAETTQPGPIPGSKPGEPRVYAPTYYPGTVDRREATRVEVHPGDVADANFNLIASRIFTVRGSVSGVPTPPSPGAEHSTVFLRSANEQSGVRLGVPISADGTFEISGVLPGSYRAGISARSGAIWRVVTTGQTIEVRNSDVDGIRLSPEPPNEVRGRFRMDTNGHIPDWTQLNIQIGPDDRDDSTNAAFGKIAKDGSFNLEIPPGNYHVVVTSNANGESWRDFIMKEVLLNGKDVGDSGFSVTSGMTSLEIVASAQGSSIEGNVVDEDGKPVANIPVVCIPDASRRKRRDIYQQVQTDRQGHFALRGLNPGEYQVFTLDDPADDITDPDFVSAHESLGQTVTLEPAERKGIVLKISAESQP